MTELEQLRSELQQEKSGRKLAEEKLQEFLSAAAPGTKNLETEANELSIALSLSCENPDPLLRIDQSGSIVYQNPAAKQLSHFEIAGNFFNRKEFGKWIIDHSLQQTAHRFEVETKAGDNYYMLSCVRVERGGFVNVYGKNANDQVQARAALSSANTRWRFAFEGSGDGVWEFDAQSGACIFSKKYKENLGYAEDDWKDDILEWRNRIHPEDKAIVEKSDKAYETGEQQSHVNEYRIQRKDGSYTWVMDRGMVLKRDPDGKPVYFMGVQTIIERQKQLESELFTNAARLSSLIDNMLKAVLLINDAGEIQLANKSFSRLFFDLSIDAKQISGRKIDDIIGEYPNQFANLTRVLGSRSFVKKQKQRWGDEVFHLKNGRIVSVEYIPLFIQQVFDGHMFLFADITEAKLAEQKLVQAEAKYRGIIENMNLGLVETDEHQHIQYANQRFCQMVDYPLQELLGKRPGDLYLTDEAVVAEKKMLRELGISDTYEVSITTKGGHVKWWLFSGAPRYNDTGKFIGTLGINLDITNRIELEREVRAARYNAERASQVKDLFLSNVSHEIRTPLNAVIGMSTQLQRTFLDDQQKRYVDVIGRAAKNLLIIINDLLDFSKIEAGELRIENRSFQLREVIKNVTSVMEHRAEEKGVLLDVAVSDTIAPVLVGDAFHINQIILNLTSNAIKFTEKGNVTLKFIDDGIINNSQQLIFEVSDTGIGMDSAFLEKGFEKFTTEDGTNTRPYGGTGLGLSITKELVELMGGSLHIASQKDRGTTVTARLQLALGNKADLLENKETDADLSILANKKVLVVEDNEMNQLVADTILTHNGLQVSLAANGLEALEKLAIEKYDVVLMDMKMPVMDGIEATRKLRKNNPGLPVIALTANALKGEQEKCVEAGMNDFITKPFEENVLLATVARWMKERPQVTNAADTFKKPGKLFSLAKLEEISKGNIEFLKTMVAIFIDDAMAATINMNEALEAGNGQLIHEIAHKIKPSIGNYDIPFVEEIKKIEQLSLNNPKHDELKLLIKKFDDIILQVVEGLKIWEAEANNHAK